MGGGRGEGWCVGSVSRYTSKSATSRFCDRLTYARSHLGARNSFLLFPNDCKERIVLLNISVSLT